MTIAALNPWISEAFSLKGSVESLQYHFDEFSRSGNALQLAATPTAALGSLIVGYLLAILVGLVFRIGSLPAKARESVAINLIPSQAMGRSD